ncbi:hypothetical protein [Streptomyces violaceusniger]|uniref:hypothetical protein n=1 Tax=Streptomyces violaceusniger TaxID=68280 RepID=UPI0033651D9C
MRRTTCPRLSRTVSEARPGARPSSSAYTSTGTPAVEPCTLPCAGLTSALSSSMSNCRWIPVTWPVSSLRPVCGSSVMPLKSSTL